MPAVDLRADPVVADKHHRLFSVRMHDIGKTADALRHKTFQQLHIVEECLLRLTEMVVEISFVNKVFQRNFITELFAEQTEHGGACRHGIPEPIEVLYAVFIVVNIEKMVKERGKPHDGNSGILFQPCSQIVLHKRERFGIDGIDIPVLCDRPAVCFIVVDLCGVPQNFCKKINRIFVHGNGAFDFDAFIVRVVMPCFNFFSRRTVKHLPIGNRILVERKLLRRIMRDGIDQKAPALGEDAVAHQGGVLHTFGVLISPIVVAAR